MLQIPSHLPLTHTMSLRLILLVQSNHSSTLLHFYLQITYLAVLSSRVFFKLVCSLGDTKGLGYVYFSSVDIEGLEFGYRGLAVGTSGELLCFRGFING